MFFPVKVGLSEGRCKNTHFNIILHKGRDHQTEKQKRCAYLLPLISSNTPDINESFYNSFPKDIMPLKLAAVATDGFQGQLTCLYSLGSLWLFSLQGLLQVCEVLIPTPLTPAGNDHPALTHYPVHSLHARV